MQPVRHRRACQRMAAHTGPAADRQACRGPQLVFPHVVLRRRKYINTETSSIYIYIDIDIKHMSRYMAIDEQLCMATFMYTFAYSCKPMRTHPRVAVGSSCYRDHACPSGRAGLCGNAGPTER